MRSPVIPASNKRDPLVLVTQIACQCCLHRGDVNAIVSKIRSPVCACWAWSNRDYCPCQPHRRDQQEGYRAGAFRLYAHRFSNGTLPDFTQTSHGRWLMEGTIKPGLCPDPWHSGHFASGATANTSMLTARRSSIPTRKVVPRPEGRLLFVMSHVVAGTSFPSRDEPISDERRFPGPLAEMATLAQVPQGTCFTVDFVPPPSDAGRALNDRHQEDRHNRQDAQGDASYDEPRGQTGGAGVSHSTSMQVYPTPMYLDGGERILPAGNAFPTCPPRPSPGGLLPAQGAAGLWRPGGPATAVVEYNTIVEHKARVCSRRPGAGCRDGCGYPDPQSPPCCPDFGNPKGTGGYFRSGTDGLTTGAARAPCPRLPGAQARRG
jgi:hypothetical protein